MNNLINMNLKKDIQNRCVVVSEMTKSREGRRKKKNVLNAPSTLFKAIFLTIPIPRDTSRGLK
jgi:hypothetical protein